MFSIDLANRQNSLEFDGERLRRAVEVILRDAGILAAEVSIAVVDDPTIHALNRQYLDHDCPTDVLSFALERDGQRVEGEVIVSSDTALRMAVHYGWSADDELALYVVHGTLHLVGYDDGDPRSISEMRAAERRYLALLGIEPRERPPAPRPWGER
jgi:probable rRNA maturation factor